MFYQFLSLSVTHCVSVILSPYLGGGMIAKTNPLLRSFILQYSCTAFELLFSLLVMDYYSLSEKILYSIRLQKAPKVVL